jgi:hypothetical protein
MSIINLLCKRKFLVLVTRISENLQDTLPGKALNEVLDGYHYNCLFRLITSVSEYH